jgi:formylglycine-generating enzyme required for sulfatase activity
MPPTIATLRFSASVVGVVAALLFDLAPSRAQSLTTDQERALKPGDTLKECEACPEMVVVPSGSFTMGSPASEQRPYQAEGPQHLVTFARPFAVGKFAVTFAEWDACRADRGCSYRPAPDRIGKGKRPVDYMWWKFAQQYVAWLSRKTGKSYRLLSESEREYVTRAGTTTPYWWGSSISSQQANYCAATDPMKFGKSDDCRFQSVPVDRYQPNPWGIYQLHGNLWEWVEDCWNEDYQGAPTDGSAWKRGDCNKRVLRGGSHAGQAFDLRSARRERGEAPSGDSNVGGASDWGLRVARTLATP